MTATATATNLPKLGAETWGERIARAQRRSGLTYREAAERVSQFHPVSFTSLMRLEAMTEPPTRPSRRYLAYLTVVTYGFDPADFGLSDGDLPRGLTPEGVRDVLFSSFTWDAYRPGLRLVS